MEDPLAKRLRAYARMREKDTHYAADLMDAAKQVDDLTFVLRNWPTVGEALTVWRQMQKAERADGQ